MGYMSTITKMCPNVMCNACDQVDPIYSKPIVTEISIKKFFKYESHKQLNFKGKAWSKNRLSTYNSKEINTYIN